MNIRIVIPIVILLLLSCSESSKDQNYVKSNEEINLNNLTVNEQRNHFRTLDAEEKYNLWMLKIEKLLSSCKNQNEKEFITINMRKLNKGIFETPLSDDEFNRNWSVFLNTLFVKYFWTDKDVFLAFSTLYDVEFSLNKSIDRIKEPPSFEPVLSDDCNCKWSLFCPGTSECIKNDNCPVDNEDTTGCGWFGAQTCVGKCWWND